MLSIDLGIGLTSIAVAVRQAVNYATTWPFSTYAQANNGALPGPWADVRRTGTATYENASGVITTLPDLGGGTYAARVQYRSGTARGLLIEGQATQLFRTTDNCGSAQWGRTNVTCASGAAVGPYGSSSMSSVVVGSSAFANLNQIIKSGGMSSGSAAARFALRGSASCTSAMFGIYDSIAGWVQTSGSYRVASGPGTISVVSSALLSITGLTAGDITVVEVVRGGGVSGDVLFQLYPRNLSPSASDTIYFEPMLAIDGSALSSSVPNIGTGTVVRAADSAGVFLTSTALSAAFPGGVGQPWTTVFQYRKGYSVSSDETLFALSAGSSAGSTNLLALQTNGTQAQAVHSGGSGTLSGTLVHDGSTVNKIALSVDPTTGKVSISVNGATAVETTGIAFTGAGVTHLIPGARTTGGDTPVAAMEIYDWRNVNTAYTTGASLQALSA